jgi:hypothetical protein
MADNVTIIAGVPIPSTSPFFLTVVAFHVMLGIVCTVAGLVASLSMKGRGRHSHFGMIYYWCLLGLFVTALGLSAVHWAEDYHLVILGALSFGAAHFGRLAAQRHWRNWPSLHLSAMGGSYILLLTAFYVDNGKNLPLWRQLPQIDFWFLPSIVGVPIILYALRRHPVVLAYSRAQGRNQN